MSEDRNSGRNNGSDNKGDDSHSSDNRKNSVLITGGTQGLGLAIAESLVERGCGKITITGRNAKRGQDAADGLNRDGVDCKFIRGDVAKIADCEAMVAGAIAHHGAIDGLVNCAADTSRGTLTETSPELWDRHINTNLRGPFLLMQGFVKHRLQAGKPGSIVNILSTSAHVGQSFLAAYSTSKGGLMTLTRNTANAYRHNHIRCNAVAPGWMDTPGEDTVQKTFHDAPDDWLERAEKQLPMGQLVKPRELAPLVAYLLGPGSGLITGAIINYDQQIIGAVPE